MHEVSIAEAIIDVVKAEVEKAGAASAAAITLSVGELSGVQEDQLRFCFPIVAKGTVAEDATLTIHRVSGKARCQKCNEQYDLPDLFTPCSACGSFAREVFQGKELLVASLELT